MVASQQKCIKEVVLLIRPSNKSPQSVFDLTPQQCEVLSLSQWMARAKVDRKVIMTGPQTHSPYLPRTPTASSALCLPGNLWSCFGNQIWPSLVELDMRDQQCSQASTQGFGKHSFPTLQTVFWSAGELSIRFVHR